MATSVRIPSRTVQRATVGEALDTREAPPHPLDALRAARRDLLAALQSHTTSDLLRPGVAGEPCGRDVLLRMAAWLHELAHLVPDLATYGYQRGEPCDPGPDWSAQSEAQIAPHHEVRPEAAVARVVTAHARLLAALEGLDDAGLRRRGPTRFGVETSGWDLLVAEAAHEREHAARLMARPRQPARGAVAPAPGRVRGGRDDKTWMPTVTHPDRRRRAAPGHHGGAPAGRGAAYSGRAP
jgi:hypothetical protein